MISTPAQVAEFQKSQLDALFALSHTMFEATEKLVDLNLAATKALLEESAEKTQVMLGVKDVQDFLAVGSGLAQPTLEKVVSYNRNVYGIASGAGADFSKIFETQIAQNNKQVAEMIDFASKNTPTGAEPVASMQQGCQAGRRHGRIEFQRCHRRDRQGRQRCGQAEITQGGLRRPGDGHACPLLLTFRRGKVERERECTLTRTIISVNRRTRNVTIVSLAPLFRTPVRNPLSPPLVVLSSPVL